MMKTTAKPLTFEELLEQLPDDEGIYELVNGEIARIQPTRGHDNVAEFLDRVFFEQIRPLKLNYVVKGTILVRTETRSGQEQGRHPDVCAIDKTLWNSDVCAYSALTEPFELAVEVASTNWCDDYIDKLDEYQRLGIREYWIVDDRMMASKQYFRRAKATEGFCISAS